MMKRFYKLLALAMALAMAATFTVGCGGKQSEEPAGTSDGETPFKFAVVFATGGLGDKSFNDSVYAGAVRAQEELGAEMQYVEPTEIAEFEGHHREFAKSGEYDLIFGIGYDQQDAITKVAAEYPEQKFVLIDGEASGENVASAFFNDNEKAFLMGILFGMTTKANQVGMVGGMDIPLIEKFYSGFKCGVAYVNPEAEVSEKFVGGWADVNTGKEIALSMYDSGCDILYAVAGGSGLGVHAAAKETGKLSAGSNGNQNAIDPEHIIASTMRNLDELVFSFVKDTMDGNFTPGQRYYGVDGDFMDAVVDGSNVPISEEALAKKEEAKEAIKSGEIVVPSTLEEAEKFIANLG